MAALRNYRQARGICFKCGERWGQGHQCGPTVQLHVVEELLDLLQANPMEPAALGHDSDDEVLMSISKVATTGQTTPHTVRLIGSIGDQVVVILVDSGSSHSFISEAVAARIPHKVTPPTPITVKIADGGALQCTGFVPKCGWKTQGHKFETGLRVLPLGCYDMVVGMDWLQQCGLMWVDWTEKILQFKHKESQISLVGVQSQLHSLQHISLDQLCSLEASNAVAHIVALKISPSGVTVSDIPEEIQQVLDQFQAVIEEPTKLPPHRAWDHSIPLLPGVKPVNIRPYRYTLEPKMEIEAQVKKMLKAGLIVESQSPFSSPILLVKKKYQTWASVHGLPTPQRGDYEDHLSPPGH